MHEGLCVKMDFIYKIKRGERERGHSTLLLDGHRNDRRPLSITITSWTLKCVKRWILSLVSVHFIARVCGWICIAPLSK
jgi:hypothetical protein